MNRVYQKKHYGKNEFFFCGTDFLAGRTVILSRKLSKTRIPVRDACGFRIGGNKVDEDFLLVFGIRNGKEDAAEAFVRKYYSEILNYCFARTGDFMQAEDITQQTFLNFFRSIGRYEHRGKAKNFLYVTAGNLCKNFYEQKGRLRETFMGEEEWKAADAAGRDAAGYDPVWKTAEKISVREALLQLPEEQREVVLLYYFQELKIKEIAAILGQTQSNVKYRLKAAKDKLKEILRKEDFT